MLSLPSPPIKKQRQYTIETVTPNITLHQTNPWYRSVFICNCIFICNDLPSLMSLPYTILMRVYKFISTTDTALYLHVMFPPHHQYCKQSMLVYTNICIFFYLLVRCCNEYNGSRTTVWHSKSHDMLYYPHQLKKMIRMCVYRQFQLT